MKDDNALFDTEKDVEYIHSPEDTPEGAQNFSMEKQRQEFLGGESQNNPHQESSSRRLKVFEISRFVIEKPKVEGIENIPPNPCVIATTHLSDIDVQEVAMAVAGKRKIGIVSQETNLNFPLYKPFVAALGKENFFPLTNAPYKGAHTAHSLRIEDFKKMEDGITEDKRTMIIAGHNPTRNWQLAENPGIGPVILAHLAKAPLVPAALDIESTKPVAQATDIKSYLHLLKRPSAKIIFGEPMNLPEIPEDKLRAAVALYSPDQRRDMTQEQLEEAKKTLEILQKEAGQMMESLAAKLPPEKRGKWGQNSSEQNTNTIQ